MSHVIGTPGAPCPGPRRFPSGVRVVIPPAVPYPLGHPVRTVNGVLPDEHGDIRVADATATERGLMSAEDKAKLDGVEAGAEVNAVATVKVDGAALVPDEGRAVDIDLTGKADKATTLAGYGITDAKIANGTIILGANSITPLTSHQSLDAYVNAADYDSTAKKILLKHGSTTVAEVDATAFIKDGMVSSVEIDDGKLVITFNTDAGQEPIEIPLTDIFNPANYYDKTAADAAFVAKVEGKGLSTEDYTTAEKTKLSGIAAGAEVNVIETVKVNGTALTPSSKAVDITVPTGSAANKDVPTSGDASTTQVVMGNDSRLSDARTPISHTHTASAVTDLGDAATKNVGTTSGTVAAGDDSRFSDARTPTAHASSHATGGSDAIAPSDIGAAASSHTHAASDISGLATVATSGSYNDLSDKPTIPAAQVQSDWNQSDSTAKDYIKNKPTIPTVPTNVSAFTNDAGYLTVHQSWNDVKPSGGITASDLAAAVQTSLGKADTALQSHQDITGKADKTDIAPDWMFNTQIGTVFELNELCSHYGGIYRCILGYTFSGEEDTPSGDATHWALATVEDVLAALRTAVAGKQDVLSAAQLANIAAVPNKADASSLRYDLPTNATAIDTASQETVGGETVNYGEATLADRTGNRVSITAALDELRVTFPPAVSGKLRDFGLRVEVGTGSAALTAPALVPVAPTGETIKMENNAKQIPALADGTATAKGVTLLYFSESAPGVFFAKGEQVEEVA